MTEIEKRLHLAFLSSLAALGILSPFALYFSAISAYFAYIIWVFFLILIRKNIKISYTWVLLRKKEPVPILIMTYYWIVSITSFSPMFYLWPIIQKKVSL